MIRAVSAHERDGPARRPEVRLGLRANLGQFTLLVVVNAFVGAMVGLERSILPAIAEQDFQLAARAAVLSFIVVFGVTKAATNYLAGRWSDAVGRKAILVGGWIVASPVPFLLMWAPSWGWVLFANALLGVSQGLTWSTTVIMKIDLAGPARRGLAMGLNEFSGYVAVALSALATGYVAAAWALRPQPFYLGVVFVLAGLSLSAVLVRETRGHARREARDHAIEHPAVWGVGQLATGALSDRVGRKWLIAVGMWVQAAGIALVALSSGFTGFAAGGVLLGAGTAMVYPTLLAAIGDVAHPTWRASSVGVYRLWRDLGYAIGALLAGVTADVLGAHSAIWLVAAITFASGAVVAVRMRETRRRSAS